MPQSAFYSDVVSNAVVKVIAKVSAKLRKSRVEIRTADLYSTYVLARCGGQGYTTCDGYQLPRNVHYTAQGQAALAARMRHAPATTATLVVDLSIAIRVKIDNTNGGIKITP